MPFADSDNPLAIEIRQEAASAYFAACRRMVDALAALKAFDGGSAGAMEAHERMARRLELFEEAVERVFFVVIQREAMKLSCSPVFFENYEVPEEVRARLGPRRRK